MIEVLVLFIVFCVGIVFVGRFEDKEGWDETMFKIFASNGQKMLRKLES